MEHKEMLTIQPLEKEAVLRFKSDEAYQRFLREAAGLGLNVLGQIDKFRAVRIGFDSAQGLRDGLQAALILCSIWQTDTSTAPCFY